MELAHGWPPSPLYGLSTAFYLGLMVWVMMSAPWHELNRPRALHLWLGTTVLLVALWVIYAGARIGLNCHLLGATLVTLMFGPELAILSLGLVLATLTAANAHGIPLGPPIFADLLAFPAHAISLIFVPVLVTHFIHGWARSKMPRPVFGFIFLNVFFAAIAAMVMSGLAWGGWLLLTSVYTWPTLVSDFLPYYTLLAWAEAFLTGIVISLLAVYRPAWLKGFNGAVYVRAGSHSHQMGSRS